MMPTLLVEEKIFNKMVCYTLYLGSQPIVKNCVDRIRGRGNPHQVFAFFATVLVPYGSCLMFAKRVIY